MDTETCQAAAKALGLTYRREKTWAQHVKGCIKAPGQKIWFNNHETGGNSTWATAVCEKETYDDRIPLLDADTPHDDDDGSMVAGLGALVPLACFLCCHSHRFC